MTTLSDRITYLLSLSTPPMDQAELAKICKVKAPSVSDWLNGKTKNLQGSTLVRLVEHFMCSPIWLATGEGEPFREDASQALYKAPEKSKIVAKIKPKRDRHIDRVLAMLEQMSDDGIQQAIGAITILHSQHPRAVKQTQK